MRTALVTCFVGLFAATAGVAQGQTVFFDTFRDGDAQDGMPVTWEGNDLLRVENRSLVLETASSSDESTSTTVSELTLTDTSIRSQFRLLEGNRIGLSTRGQQFGQIFADGLAMLGDMEVQTDFDPKNEDLIMQVDAIGEIRSGLLEMWIWRPGDSMPSEPTLSTSVRGSTGPIFAFVQTDPISQDLASAAFRYVHVAESHIPEPSTAIIAALAGVGFVACGRRRRSHSRP